MSDASGDDASASGNSADAGRDETDTSENKVDAGGNSADTSRDSATKAREDREREELLREQSRKNTTVGILVAATLVEIVLSFAFITAIYLGFGLVIYRVIGVQTPVPMQLLSPVVFVGGIALGYIAHKKILRLVIDKAGLKDRLRPDVYDQYLTRKERQEKERMR